MTCETKTEFTSGASTSRRMFLSQSLMLSGALVSSITTAAEKDKVIGPETLDFEFIKNPPGTLHSIGTHRLHGWLMGSGDTTVLFEPGLGGSSLEFLPLAEELSTKTQICLYDRAGYAWSDPGLNPRHVIRLATEIKLLMQTMQLNNPLVLVGHSYGGLIMRQLANLMPDKIKGLVLVDASHEDQFLRLAGHSDKSMLLTSNHFVITRPDLPPGLRDDVRKKILAFSRMRKTYSAVHAEIASFEVSCEHIGNTRKEFDFPVSVISRGLDPHSVRSDNGEKHRIWQEMQSDMLLLSQQSQQRIATNSGHHIHVDEPHHVRDSILELLV